MKNDDVKKTWIEFSLPLEWEEECWAVIDEWLEAKQKQSEDLYDLAVKADNGGQP